MDKSFPIWQDTYKVDNEIIDAQHEELFRLASLIENMNFRFVTRHEVKIVLTKLFHYIKDHFKEEEIYMKNIHYPYLNEHRQMHKTIVKNIANLIQTIKTTNDLKEKLYILVSDWVTKHILYHDMMIKKWEREKKEETSSSGEYDNFVSEELIFVYTCPCHTVHKLNYEEHIKIFEKNEGNQCKKCKNPLVFVEIEELVEGNDL